MRRFAPRLLACALFAGGAAQAHPFTIHDLLAEHRLGEVTTSPDGRWLVVATTDPVTTVRRWALDGDSDMSVARLKIFDLAHDAAARDLLDPGGRGLTPGPYSPSGRHMTVLGVRDESVEVGIADLETGAIIWTGVRPIVGDLGRAMQWRSDTDLVIAALNADAQTPTRGYRASVQARLNAQWNKTVSGQVGLTYFGSGRYLAKVTEPPRGRLVVVSLDQPAPRPLLTGDLLDLEVAPDGRRAAVLVEAELIGAPSSGPASLADRAARRRRLVIVDLATGAAWEPTPDLDIATSLMRWSPSGRQILYHARPKGRPWSQGHYWRAAPGDQTASALGDPSLASAVANSPYGSILPRGDWMGEVPITLARRANPAEKTAPPTWRLWSPGRPVDLERALPDGTHALEATSAKALVFSAGGKLFKVGADGKARMLGEGSSLPSSAMTERLRFNERPSVASARFLLSQNDGGAPAQLDPRGHLARTGPSTPTTETLLAVTARVSVSRLRDAHGVETVRLRTEAGPVRDLVTINRQLAEVDFVTPQPVRHPGPGGATLTSWLYLPQGLAAGTSPPLVIVPYPGRNYPSPPAEHAPPSPWSYANPQLLAGAGFVVLIPSLPVIPSQEPAEGMADRVLAIAEAAKAQGMPLDLNRMGVLGQSYGGYGALVLATQSPRFKAIVATAANADLGTHYARRSLRAALFPAAGYNYNISAAWAETGQGRLGVPPWQDPALYTRNSPLYHAGAVTAPVLMVQGDLDAIQTSEFFAALYRQNKDAQLLSYNAESHTLTTPANQIDEWTRIIAFLQETLK